ncbi:MAG TPA: phage holin family protein [Vicinamibacterales bacterium]|nr:phage holin family protein [Vicinamibacterales bacterium]
MNPFLVSLLANAVGLWVAARFVPGLLWQGTTAGLVGVAILFGLVNAFVRPEAQGQSGPRANLTLGLSTFAVNGLMLWLTGAVGGVLGLTFHVAGFLAACLGALVISLISTPLSVLARGRRARPGGSPPRDAEIEAPDRGHRPPDERERS